MRYSYLIALLVSIVSMVLIDHRYKLALFLNLKRTLKTLTIGVIFFALWDAMGIALNIFFSGNSKYMTGWYIFPDFPVEEVFFLILMCYFTLILYRLGEKKWQNI